MAILVTSHTLGDPALCKPQEERALSLRIPPGVTSHHWKPPAHILSSPRQLITLFSETCSPPSCKAVPKYHFS